MRKTLRIIFVSAGIISIVSAVILGCIYLEDIVCNLKKVKNRLTNKLVDNKYNGEENDYE